MLIGGTVMLIKEWALFKLLQQSLRQTISEKLNIVCLGTNSSILHLVYQMFCHRTLGSAWPKSSTLEQLQTSEKTRNKPCWWITWSLNIKSQSQNTYSLLSYTPPTPPHPPPKWQACRVGQENDSTGQATSKIFIDFWMVDRSNDAVAHNVCPSVPDGWNGWKHHLFRRVWKIASTKKC